MLPKNGRVIIIDNDPKEARPLFSILSQKRIPYNYYTGEVKELPDAPVSNGFRILFLDLNLVEKNENIKEIISVLNGIFLRIIPDNPGPYLLVIWSKKGNTDEEALKHHFIDNLPNKAPAKIIFLQKKDYFDFTDGEWVEKDGCIQNIEADLFNALENISILKNLIRWENIVHDSSFDTLNEVSSFYPINESWDKNLKAVFYKLAKAIVGSDEVGTLNDKQKISKAFHCINTILFDSIESLMNDEKLVNTSDVIDGTITESISIKINTKIHSINGDHSLNSFAQGNIYVLPNKVETIKTIIREKVRGLAPVRQKLIDESDPWLVQLDITPACDYSQDKEYVRTILGVAIDKEYAKNCANLGVYFYKTPILKFPNKERFILFDFRQIITMTKGEIVEREIAPVIKLRKELCSDIQAHLSHQINRPGVSIVE